MLFHFTQENVNRSSPMDIKDSSYDMEASALRLATKNVELAAENPTISTEHDRKDGMKTMPTACSASKTHAVQAKCMQCKEIPSSAVIGYTRAHTPNVYPAIESGIQMYPGTQPAPTSFPTTTYQQGVCTSTQPRQILRSNILTKKKKKTFLHAISA